MQCAAHPDVEARGPCAACAEGVCEACATYERDGAPYCEPCGVAWERDRASLNAGMLTSIGALYLVTLALGLVFFKRQPFVGGLAAVVAIALGRAMQVVVRAPRVTRHLTEPRDASSRPESDDG